MTPIKNCVYILLTLAPAKYATNASSSKQKHEKLAVVGPVVQKFRNWSFHVVDLQRTAKKCTKNYNARAQPLFCKCNFLFGDILAAVTAVYCERPVDRQGLPTAENGDHCSLYQHTNKLTEFLQFEYHFSGKELSYKVTQKAILIQ